LKIDKWSAAALPQTKATLQQGLPLRAERGAAGQFWTFTMSNSRRKTSTFAETIGFDAELRMHVTFTRVASGDARHHDRQRAFRPSGHRSAARKARQRNHPKRTHPVADGARRVVAKTLI